MLAPAPPPEPRPGPIPGLFPGGRAAALAITAAWALLVAAGLGLRPLLPVDETRYATVAWEMWLRGDWLVPHLNGVPYSDKPPLMFWLIHLLWSLFGVREVWARLVPPLFALASLPLTAATARRLWPERPGIAGQAPALLLGTLLWSLFATSMMFDMMVTCLDLAALCAMVAARDGRRWGWPAAGAALGLGILAKGPVVLLAPAFTALAAPWWMRGEGAGERRGAGVRPLRWVRWYAGFGLSMVVAAAIALAWALPAAKAGGPAYGDALLFKQTEERLVSSFAHQHPWWWYLPLLPGLLFPLILWPPLWRAARRLRLSRADGGTRFCLAWLVPSFVCFCLISGKQPHYLLPLFPAFALLAARAADREPAGSRRDLLPAVAVTFLFGLALALVPLYAGRPGSPGWLGEVSWVPGALLALGSLLFLAIPAPLRRPASLAALTCLLVLALHIAFAPVAALDYDVTPIARYARQLERRGVPLAWVGKYHGQLHFAGRLRRPFEPILAGQEDLWLAEHPEGRVIAHLRDESIDPSRFELRQPYRDGALVVFGLPSRPGSGRTDTISSP